MADNIQQDAALIAKAQSDLTTAMSTLQHQGKAMESELAGMASGWQGQGGSQFQIVKDKWVEQQGVMLRALNRLADALGVASKTATQTDEDARAGANSIASILDATGR